MTLVGNKRDKEDQGEINRQEALIYALRHKMTYFECSAKENIGIKEVNIFHFLIFLDF